MIIELGDYFPEFLRTYDSNILVKVICILAILSLIYLFKNFIADSIIFILKKAILKQEDHDIFNEEAIEALRKPFRLLIMVSLVYLTITKLIILGPTLMTFSNKLLISMFSVSVFWALYRMDGFFIHLLYSGYAKFSDNKNDLVSPFLRSSYRIIIAIFAVVLTVHPWYNLGILLAGVGIGGLAIAFAAKDSVANLFGSITMLIERTFNVGDYVKTTKGEGTVESIGFRSTRIRNADNSLITIPNAVMSNEAIVNLTQRVSRRVKNNISLEYSINLNLILKIEEGIRKILLENNNVEKDTFIVSLTDFLQGSLGVSIIYYIITNDYTEYLMIQNEINLKILKMLEHEKVSLAYPSNKIFLENLENE